MGKRGDLNWAQRLGRVGILFVPTLLLGCSGLLPAPAGNMRVGDGLVTATGRDASGRSYPLAAPATTGSIGSRAAIIETGSTPQSGASEQSSMSLPDVQVELGFVDADVREFARVFFAEMLQVPYSIDAGVSGFVTVRSGGKIGADKALALVRQALAASGNALRVSDGVFRVAPSGSAGIDQSEVRNIRVRFIDPIAAQGAIAGLIQGRAEIISAGGGVISLRGDAETLALAQSVIESVDIDRFAASSFGYFPLERANASAVSAELTRLFEGAGATGNTVLGIDRTNSVLVITGTAEAMTFANRWIDRLDQGSESERSVRFYEVQHRDAEELAALVQTVFAEAAPATSVTMTVSSEGDSVDAPGGFLAGASQSGALKITADKIANRLVILSTPKEFEAVQQALRRLDTPQGQVYVEATIAEVRLGGELERGVRWFLESGGLSFGYSDASNGAVAPSFPGFNFSFQVPSAQIVISALEARTQVRVVSTPQLTVVDRQTASIQVGDQVPVITKSVQTATDGGAVIANDVSFRDTGVILKVTPQIRPSGDVLIQIEQEVSSVARTTTSQIDSPTISQRRVSSQVLAPDGAAIVLAGLMSSGDETSGGGLPGTQNTLLEAIFGSKKESASRTELIAIIRPVIIKDRSDLRDVAREVAEKMQRVMEVPTQ